MTIRRLFSSLLFLLLLALSARGATDPDFGWHLRTGEYIVTTPGIPRVDFFSYTANGEPWVTHEWLVQVVIYLLYATTGLGGLVFFFALLTTLSYWLIYLRSDNHPYVAGFTVLFAALAGAPFWGIRPQTVALLLTGAFLFLLDRYRRRGASRELALLVLLMLVWANSHGSFALGPILILVYLSGDVLDRVVKWPERAPNRWRDSQILALVAALCVAVIALNPNGLALYPYPFQTLGSGVIQNLIQEWQPPDLRQLTMVPFGLMLAATVALLGASRRRVDLVWLLLLAALTFASLRSARQISIWVLIAAPVIASALPHVLPFPATAPRLVPPSRNRPVLNAAVFLLVLVGLALRLLNVVTGQAQAERQLFPEDAVAQMSARSLQGPIFNQYEWGGYLIWRLYPRERVFIDGRSDLYSLNGDRIVREYLEVLTAQPGWQSILTRYRVNLVLVGPGAPVAAALRSDGGWQLEHEDSTALLFRKR
jgi:hypothetical protein